MNVAEKNNRSECVHLLHGSKVGTLVACSLMFTALLLLIWLMNGSSTHASFQNLFSGRAFSLYFANPTVPIKAWYQLTSAFLAVAGLLTALARWVLQKISRSDCWCFVIPTVVMWLYLLLIWTMPVYWLVHYVADMGPTLRRINGLVYGLIGYVVIFGFMLWSVWPWIQKKSNKPPNGTARKLACRQDDNSEVPDTKRSAQPCGSNSSPRP
ncbi:MAG: hypothetical protein WCK89_14465 [bacterium]